MKGLGGGPKVLLVHSSSNKPSGGGSGSPWMGRRRLWLVVFLACFACVSLASLLSAARDASSAVGARRRATGSASGARLAVSAGARRAAAAKGDEAAGPGLPAYVFDALVQYAAVGGNTSGSMPAADVRAIAAALKRRAPCNLLVFGLGGETPLWRALNHGGRTVFLDENQWYVSRPVQNLLFSDCRLAINDLPNQLYDVAWDVILVDGPRGYTASSPGRMSAIFTAGVLARARKEEGAATDVLVHDYEREVERACSREFLCEENRVPASSTRSLAHFVIRGGRAVRRDAFCGRAAAATDTAAQ
ncbi:unnamed protein product [Triticum turgidum subsp. durum]|uniref:Polysaccharide biosynthesis domain-containing protein n=1 Tax=Triticum turgidum subsp. durum TaxID=4567 RepID=A0A9R0ZKP7_TRITD|nr:unnamed protein product [Triticum turgidum subsp. durum]